MQSQLDNIKNIANKSSIWQSIREFFNITIYENTDKSVHITIGVLLLVVAVYIITSIFLNILRRLFTKKLPPTDKAKFNTVFSFARWLVYLIVFLIVFDSVGINVTALFAASAALLIGVGLALQTLFQDIISGIFILIDQSVHVGDIIEIDDKVGRVEEIKLRTTRTVTLDNKVLIIPNHLYLTNSLYNWTQNGTSTRESISVGVAYGSDVEQVQKTLLQAATQHPKVLPTPVPRVLFTDFGDSALNFELIFTINDSFQAVFVKSDIRFNVDALFRKHQISIPFPQRDIHIKK